MAKKGNYKITINLTDITCGRDVYAEFAATKFYNKIPLTIDELTALVHTLIDVHGTASMVEAIMKDFSGVISNIATNVTTLITSQRPTKKPNVFKRFWNWITRKK